MRDSTTPATSSPFFQRKCFLAYAGRNTRLHHGLGLYFSNYGKLESLISVGTFRTLANLKQLLFTMGVAATGHALSRLLFALVCAGALAAPRSKTRLSEYCTE